MSKFSRRHYQDIANLIRNLDVLARDTHIQKYINMFEKDNPSFDRKRFIDACVPPVIEITAAGKRELLKHSA